MIIIGNIESFAVKIKFNEPKDDWFFGNMCYVANGDVIGDLFEETSLSTAVGFLNELLWAKGIRENQELYRLSGTDLYESLQKKLYSTENLSLTQCEDNWDLYGKYLVIGNGIDIFDGWKGYLLSHGGSSKLVVRDKGDNISEYILELDEFDSVITKAVECIENEIKILT